MSQHSTADNYPYAQIVTQPLVQPSTSTTNGRHSVDEFPKFDRRTAIGLGTTLIVAAILGMIMNGVDIMSANFGGSVSFLGHGFWIGAMVIVAGVFGVTAGMRKTRGLIIAFNVMCIVAASLNAIQFLLGVLFSVAQASNYNCHEDQHDVRHNLYYRRPPCPKVSIAMEAVLAFLAVVEAIAAICGSVMCCKVACCCDGCCSNAPVSQTMTINDVPLTVIYQPQQRTISVAYAAGPLPVPGPSQAPVQDVVVSPPPYSNIDQATSSGLQALGATSMNHPAFYNSGEEEKRRI